VNLVISSFGHLVIVCSILDLNKWINDDQMTR